MPPAGAPDVVVVGELNADVVVALGADGLEFGQVERLVEDARLTLGSSGAITAAALVAQGVGTHICATVGDDPVGDFVLDRLSELGVGTSGVRRLPGRRTGLTVVLSRPGGDRALLTFPGTMGETVLAHIDVALVASARHVHVSSPFLLPALSPDLAQVLSWRAPGARASLDPGYDPAEDFAAALALFAGLDYVLPNRTELAGLHAAARAGGRRRGQPGGPTPAGSADDPALAQAAALAALGPVVVVKDGAAGAFAHTGSELLEAGTTAETPLDTTGAGDNFNAGFLAGLLAGADLGGALARAVASGAVALRGRGGTGSMADAETAVALARAHPVLRRPAGGGVRPGGRRMPGQEDAGRRSAPERSTITTLTQELA